MSCLDSRNILASISAGENSFAEGHTELSEGSSVGSASRNTTDYLDFFLALSVVFFLLPLLAVKSLLYLS